MNTGWYTKYGHTKISTWISAISCHVMLCCVMSRTVMSIKCWTCQPQTCARYQMLSKEDQWIIYGIYHTLSWLRLLWLVHISICITLIFKSTKLFKTQNNCDTNDTQMPCISHQLCSGKLLTCLRCNEFWHPINSYSEACLQFYLHKNSLLEVLWSIWFHYFSLVGCAEYRTCRSN